MGGTFSRDNRPILPGAYFNVEPLTETVPPPNSGFVVAIPIVHTWGPTGPHLVQSFASFEAIFGKDASAGRLAVHGAFRGEDVPGWGGAGAVIVNRMVGDAGAPAARTLTSTAGGADAVELEARYDGSRGNRLKVAVMDTAGVASSTDVVIYDDTTELERYTFAEADTQALVDAINESSDWVTATFVAVGPLTDVLTPASLTGGDDGATLDGGDWSDAMSAFETERFGVFAPYDLTDATIQASVKVWTRDLNATGKRFRTVLGGATADTTSAAITRAALFDDPNVIMLGGFVVNDVVEGELNSSQIVPRYAGILAQRGEVFSTTAARLGGIDRIVSGPTTAGKLSMFKGGVIGVGRDSDPVAPVRFEAAVTTFTTKTDAARPYAIFRNPKYVATMQGIEMEVTEYAESNVLGKTVVNSKTRDALVGEMRSRMQRRVDAQVIQSGFTVEVDQNPPPTDDDTYIALRYGVKFGRTAEQVFGTLTVG